jgi:hypothetical protein
MGAPTAPQASSRHHRRRRLGAGVCAGTPGPMCTRARGGAAPGGQRALPLSQPHESSRLLRLPAAWRGRRPPGPMPLHAGTGADVTAAQALAKRGIPSTVFDTGEHGVGGRLGTRASCDGSLRLPDRTPLPEHLQAAGLAFDHAAQYMTVTDARYPPARPASQPWYRGRPLPSASCRRARAWVPRAHAWCGNSFMLGA